jgi:hypothetical protein
VVSSNNLEGFNTDKFLNAIHKAESNNSTKLDLPNATGESTALGPFQIINSTRSQIYNTYYKDVMTKEEFDKNYVSDFQFAKKVASKYLDINAPLVSQLQQKYNIPPEYSQSILYFLGVGDGPKYIEDYISTGSHKFAQQKLDERIIKRKGYLPKNQTVENYVRVKINSYYSQ